MTETLLATDRESAELLQLQYQVSSTIYGSQDPAEVLETLAGFIAGGYSYGEILLLEVSQPDTFNVVAELNNGHVQAVVRSRSMRDLPASDALAAVELLSIPNVESDQFLDEEEKTRLREQGIGALLLAPLVAGQRLIGLLMLTHDVPLAAPPARLRGLRSLVDQVAIIFDNQRLVREAQATTERLARQVNVLEAISRLSTGASRFLNEQELLDYMTNSFGELNLADHVGIVMLEGDGEFGVVISEYPPSVGAVGARISMRDNAMMAQAMKNPTEPYIVEQAQTNPLQPEDVKALFKELGIHGLMIIPLMAGGELIGTFGFDLYDENKRFSPEMIEIARAMGAQFAVSLQNIRLFGDARRRADQLQRIARNEAMINHITGLYQRGSAIEDMLLTTVKELGLALGARRASIRLDIPLQEVGNE